MSDVSDTPGTTNHELQFLKQQADIKLKKKDELFIKEGKNIKVGNFKLVFGYYGSMGFKSLLMCLINDFLHLIYMLILTKCNIQFGVSIYL